MAVAAVSAAVKEPCSKNRCTIGCLNRMRPSIAGRMMNRIMRRPNPSVVRNSSSAPLEACADRVGRIAVAKAPPKMPNGN